VRNGVLAAGDARYLVIHDAARPFLTRDLVTRSLAAARRYGAAICALPATDTVKEVRRGRVVSTHARGGIWLAQTPQVFRRDVLEAGWAAAGGVPGRGGTGGSGFADAGLTDEALLVERAGGDVSVVEGSPDNVKLTRPEDWERARVILARLSRRGWPARDPIARGEGAQERGGRDSA
jgi:2-C-methyl-D-erythritol 4-phosphate cytidylyltransferase